MLWRPRTRCTRGGERCLLLRPLFSRAARGDLRPRPQSLTRGGWPGQWRHLAAGARRTRGVPAGTPALRRCIARPGWRFSTRASRTAPATPGLRTRLGAPPAGTPDDSGPLLSFPRGLQLAKLAFEDSLPSLLRASLSSWRSSTRRLGAAERRVTHVTVHPALPDARRCFYWRGAPGSAASGMGEFPHVRKAADGARSRGPRDTCADRRCRDTGQAGSEARSQGGGGLALATGAQVAFRGR